MFKGSGVMRSSSYEKSFFFMLKATRLTWLHYRIILRILLMEPVQVSCEMLIFVWMMNGWERFRENEG